MKYALVLIAGCLPLAVLTGWGFVDLVVGEDVPATESVRVDAQPAAEALQRIKPALGKVQEASDLLEKADLLAPVLLADLGPLSAEARFAALGGSWPKWTAGRQFASDALDLPVPTPASDVEQLKTILARWEGLQKKYAASAPPGGEALLELLQQRIAAIREQLARRIQQSEADALLAAARGALQPGQYTQCAELCDQVLARHSALFDAATLETVRVLKRRAEFSADSEKLAAANKSAGSARQRRELLEAFLARYEKTEHLAASQVSDLERVRQDLQAAVREIQAEDWRRDGTAEVQKFLGALPEPFDARLARAVEIAERYPDNTVRARLQAEARGWLIRLVPEKTLDEGEMLREVETRDGRIVRGYFKGVSSADGRLAGYQVYPTLEQLRRPKSAVGTYGTETLLGEPSESLYRACVTQYNAARARVLAQPERREEWSALADVCRDGEKRLAVYRAKPGAAAEPLSLAQEEKSVRALVDDARWGQLQKLLAP